MDIGEFIKEKRKERHLSQRELASKCDISNAEISRIESGDRKQPSHETLKTIARALNLPVNELYEKCGYFEVSPQADDYLYIGDLNEEKKKQLNTFLLFLRSNT